VTKVQQYTNPSAWEGQGIHGWRREYARDETHPRGATRTAAQRARGRRYTEPRISSFVSASRCRPCASKAATNRRDPAAQEILASSSPPNSLRRLYPPTASPLSAPAAADAHAVSHRERTPTVPVEEKLTVKEFCEEFKISESTFYDWRAKRRAPVCIKLPNGALRIRRSDANHWAEKRTENA
jgi:predicted DNA-binding transcriptional regulator AlpA